MKTEGNYLSVSLAILSEIVGDNLPDKRTFELRCPRSGHTSNVAISKKKNSQSNGFDVGAAEMSENLKGLQCGWREGTAVSPGRYEGEESPATAGPMTYGNLHI